MAIGRGRAGRLATFVSLFSGGALRRRALRRGLLEGASGWQALAVAMIALKVLRRLAGPKVEVLARDKVRPGQSLTVSAVPRRSRRSRG